ncbi:MAG: hypothetical protein KGK03_03250 [Candidatus Omnitrophica bacterium]|nr:hypothetical protein [Candidatus Omnitrophota bacterium]MDE2222069.1 hypothetical protein [Candidatus Omnitrophota bacterium]
MKKNKKGFFKNRIKYFYTLEKEKNRLQPEDWEPDLEGEEQVDQEDEKSWQDPEERF